MAEIPGESLTHVGELAIRVAVRLPHSAGESRDDVASDGLGYRMRVLVDVEGDRDVLLGRPVWRDPSQVVAERKAIE